MTRRDPSSQSNVEEWKTRHIDLHLKVDFQSKQLKGSATLTMERIGEHKAGINLDTRDLSISDVYCNDQKVDFTLHPPNKCFGSRLEVDVSRFATVEQIVLRIPYGTSPQSTALQWMSPQQTCGRKHPYMFSQCQAIHARSMLPCQDSPAIKATYTARIEAPKELEVLMSAIRTSTTEDDDCKVHFFEQNVPIPSYLTAIVCGNLESRRIGPRSHVWSEPEMVEDCAFEFSETERMLAVAEELCGPYIWGIYDLLVLPPSFPYGGMENPCLTFVTPTLLAGDRSLSCVVAHEIAHSWTGNLVTNCTWEHFWLNEGHTVFVERKIIARLQDSKGESHRHLDMLGGRLSLKDEVERRGKESPMTVLVPDLNDVDPDDAFSCVPYEKGSSLLFYIERLVGEESMNRWLRAYIDKFARSSIDTTQWKDFLLSYFTDEVDKKVLSEVNWDIWFHRAGDLPNAPALDTSLDDVATTLAKAWLAVKNEAADREGATFAAFSPKQRMRFLDELRTGGPPSLETMKTISDYYKLADSRNAEIRYRWLLLCLKVHDEDAVKPTIEFLNQQGRMKFTRPLYRELHAWDEKKEFATKNFEAQHEFMHPITAQMVGSDLAYPRDSVHSK